MEPFEPKPVSKTMQFKVFCIEQYKKEHKLTGFETVQTFQKYGVFDYLSSFFDVLHTEGARRIVEDIELFIEARK